MVNGTRVYRTDERTCCPFYGFNNVRGHFIDSRENQCALIEDKNAPCLMEELGEKVYWINCKLNTKEHAQILEDLFRGASVFPIEYLPENYPQ